MSVYSGFVTRQLEQDYNALLEQLLIGLAKRVIAFYGNIAVQERDFAHFLKGILSQMAVFERQKYLPPKFSETAAELAQLLALQLPSSETNSMKKTKGKQRSRKSSPSSEQKQKEAIVAAKNIVNKENDIIAHQKTQEIVKSQQQQQSLFEMIPLHSVLTDETNSNWLSEAQFGEPQKSLFPKSITLHNQNGYLRRNQNEAAFQQQKMQDGQIPLKLLYDINHQGRYQGVLGNNNDLSMNNKNNQNERSAIKEEEEEEMSVQKDSQQDKQIKDLKMHSKEQYQGEGQIKCQKRAATTKRQRKRNLLLNQVYSTEEMATISKRSKSLQKGTKMLQNTEITKVEGVSNSKLALKTVETMKQQNEDKFDSIESDKTMSSRNKNIRAASLQDAFFVKSSDIPANNHHHHQLLLNNLNNSRGISKNQTQSPEVLNNLTNESNKELNSSDRERKLIRKTILINNNVSELPNTVGVGCRFAQGNQQISRQRYPSDSDDCVTLDQKNNNIQNVIDVSSTKNSSIHHSNTHQSSKDQGVNSHRSVSIDKPKYSVSKIYQKANNELTKKCNNSVNTTEESNNSLRSLQKSQQQQQQRYMNHNGQQDTHSQLCLQTNCTDMYSKVYSSNDSHLSNINNLNSNSQRSPSIRLLRQIQNPSSSFSSSTQSTAKKETKNTEEKDKSFARNRPRMPLALASISNRIGTTPSSRTKGSVIAY